MKLKGKKLAMLIIGVIMFSLFMYASPAKVNNAKEEIQKTKAFFVDSVLNQKSLFELDSVQKRDSIMNHLIAEVDDYISKQSPKANKTIAESIVKHGLNYDIDICFIMSQTQIETNFGVAGVGRESSRRSLFGVVKKRYLSYDAAIEDYSKILRKSYLVKGRTEHDLMKNYVTGSGLRYASATDYEAKLSKTYKTIVKRTNIEELQKQLENV